MDCFKAIRKLSVSGFPVASLITQDPAKSLPSNPNPLVSSPLYVMFNTSSPSLKTSAAKYPGTRLA